MGEAKRRAVAYEKAKAALLDSVSGDALLIARSSIRLFEGFILPERYTGGCYLTTMTLHRYLDKELGVSTEPVVGYVNDGTDHIMISHAWLEHEGLKVDLTLNVTEGFAAGGLIVLDQLLRPGSRSYTYHRERTPEGIAEDGRMMLDPEIAHVLRYKQAEHQAMANIVRDPELITKYLAMAPAEMGYEAMAVAMRF